MVEGRLRRSCFIDGAWVDEIIMARLAPRAEPKEVPMSAVADFTEESFRKLLHSLEQHGYRFARYGEAAGDRHVLWRHDVDFSLHRAARLAEIEAEEGVLGTYFLNPRSSFYNLLEPKIVALTRRISSLGHEIGLHFDAEAFGITQWTHATLEQLVTQERELVERKS